MMKKRRKLIDLSLPLIMNYDNSNAVKKGEVIDGYLRELFEKFDFVQNYRTLINEKSLSGHFVCS